MSRSAVVSVALVLGLTTTAVGAGEARVVDARASPAGDGGFDFQVTVEHADEGWEHYADAWEVLAPDGTVLGTRTLLHPHVNEQPFTRSLSGVRIPESIDQVRVRARDSVHGYGGDEVTVTLSVGAE